MFIPRLTLLSEGQTSFGGFIGTLPYFTGGALLYNYFNTRVTPILHSSAAVQIKQNVWYIFFYLFIFYFPDWNHWNFFTVPERDKQPAH